MKTNYIILAVMALVISACTNRIPGEELLNKKAAIPAPFNFSKAGLKVITSSINKKNKTMWILYGNDLTLKNAISGAADHTAGENLTLVTWKQQEDDRWFGARIPGDLQSVEVIKTTNSSTGATLINYQKFESNKLVLNPDTLHEQERIKYIFAQQPAVMP